MPNWEPKVIATPDGPVMVIVPTSSPVTVGIGTGLILWTTTHPPGESDVLGAYSPVYFTKAAIALLVMLREPSLSGVLL